MQNKKLAILTRDDIRYYEIANNKAMCAQQVLRPDAVPPRAPRSAVNKFFREAIFALADARYLQEAFWRELARQYGVAAEEMGRLYVDFGTNELLLKE